MEKESEFSLLIDILPQYRMVNSIYEQVSDSLKLSFESQCRITDFHNTFKDKQAFEKAVLNLLLSTDKEKLALIAANLKEEIGKNVELYTANKELFDNIDTTRVCSSRHNPLRIELEGQLKDTNKFWQELIQVRNSLESASWRGNKVATQQLKKKEEQVENLYKKEQNKLSKLYQQKEESDRNASRFIYNVFGGIYDLSSTFISLLEKYFPVEKEKTPVSAPLSTAPEAQTQTEAEPDMIFRSRMFEKFLILEKKLIEDKYLNPELLWISVHDNGKPDIKRLVAFLVGLLDNRYFLPGRDSKIKTFFESRYHITIGQNFERKRRELLLDEYKSMFFDYPF